MIEPLDFTSITRNTDKCRTTVRFENERLNEQLKDEEKGILPWLVFGACSLNIHEGRGVASFGARMRDSITDFEHDSCWAVRVDLIGVHFTYVYAHTVMLDAWITTDPREIKLHPQEFVPENVDNVFKCDDPEHYGPDHKPHLILPEDLYIPPVYEHARIVAGQRVSIRIGPKWNDDE
jgi:hypothetical protein